MRALSTSSKLALAILASSEAVRALPAARPRPLSNDDVIQLLEAAGSYQKRAADPHWYDDVFQGALEWGGDIAGHLGINERSARPDPHWYDDVFSGALDWGEDIANHLGINERSAVPDPHWYDDVFSGALDWGEDIANHLGINERSADPGSFDLDLNNKDAQRSYQEAQRYYRSHPLSLDFGRVNTRRDINALTRRDPNWWKTLYSTIDNLILRRDVGDLDRRDPNWWKTLYTAIDNIILRRGVNDQEIPAWLQEAMQKRDAHW
ncbi:hypothetical protein CB0940_10039 [Cercospora beticola]|uniref:Uncharacterized protein n=1 Tax=Cercospora beticola TaxID=122368 RepID=A0A2G5HUW9_CERBT|nr:hypothetical protein CB0940_10039 [Cercospora beticola]PIA96315.1 hypothetical protein CB0940_10039 [Cercospora beticola]WPB06735.1 hypothetical protein RHO25_011395 [Cercospora beticola]